MYLQIIVTLRYIASVQTEYAESAFTVHGDIRRKY